MTLFPDLERQLADAAGRLPEARTPAARQRRTSRRTASSAAAALALAAAVVFATLTTRGEPTDLAARAYAATTSAGLVHWRTDTSGYANSRLGSRQRTEGWALGDVRHVVRSETYHGTSHVTVDERVVGRRSRIWMSVSDDYSTATLPAHRPQEMIPSGDPFVAFRHAFRTKRLRELGGGRFEVPFEHLPAGTVVYEVDPRTGRPRQLVITNRQPAMFGRPAVEGRSVVRFSVYERLPVTRANRARLALLPHPGAGPGREPASTFFAALRTGAAPTGAEGERLRGLARNLHRFQIDPDGIRLLTEGVWLLPGRGYVCVATDAGGGGIGAGCLTVRKAVRDGISTGTPTGTTVAVPDGVGAVEARLRYHGPWRRFAAVRGVARLPGLGNQVRLVR